MSPQGKMTMQQINTPTGPKFIAVPLGQTLMQGQVKKIFGNTVTFPFPGWTLPGRDPAGRRSSPAGSKWSAGSASAGGRWSDLLLSKFRSVGGDLLLGNWAGFYASSEPLRQPAPGLIIKLISISDDHQYDCSDHHLHVENDDNRNEDDKNRDIDN